MVKTNKRLWKKISGKIIYKNSWIKLHEDQVTRPDGKSGVYGYLEKPTGVFIVPYSEKDNSIYLIQQNRYPIRKRVYEIPAGVTTNRNYLKEAKRELLEETGFTAKKWQSLGYFYVAPGHETTDIVAYLASGLSQTKKNINHQEGDEAIETLTKVRLNQLREWITSGKIQCGITLACLNLFLSVRHVHFFQ